MVRISAWLRVVTINKHLKETSSKGGCTSPHGCSPKTLVAEKGGACLYIKRHVEHTDQQIHYVTVKELHAYVRVWHLFLTLCGSFCVPVL